jgi:hypothetical protein
MLSPLSRLRVLAMGRPARPTYERRALLAPTGKSAREFIQMGDHIVTRDQLRQLLRVSNPTQLPLPTRRWTDAEWAIISQRRETYDMDDDWIVFAEADRLFFHRGPAHGTDFEARVARGDDGWAITELLVSGDLLPKGWDAYWSAQVEFLIESVALGVKDGPSWQKMRSESKRLREGQIDYLRELRRRTSRPSNDSGPPYTPGVATSMMADTDSQAATTGAASPGSSPTGGTVSAACLLCRYKVAPIATQIGTVDVPVGLCQKCSSLSCGSHGERSTAPAFLCILCDASLKAASPTWVQFKRSGGLSRLPGGRGVRGGPGTGGQADTGDDASAGTGAEETADLAYALASLFSEPDGSPSPLVVRNLEQWTAARPDYQQLMSVLSDFIDRAVQVIDEFLGSGPDAIGLPLGTAQTDPRHYGFSDVQSLWAPLGTDGRRLLASAMLLIVVLDLPVDMMPAPVAAVATMLGGAVQRRFSDDIPGIRRQVVAPQ